MATVEIGRKEFEMVQHFFDTGLFDKHHSPRNAVIGSLKKWENKELVAAALEEIIDVHHRYRNFSALTQEQAR